MTYNKSISLLSWLLWTPIKFAVISFFLMILLVAIAGLIPSFTFGTAMSLSATISVLVATGLVLYKLPRDNMDWRGFIALNNAQIIIGATIFITTIYIIQANKTAIIAKLMLANYYINTFISVTVLLLFLYLLGIFITNLYAKYLRCRDMKIAPWKIICSMPFGFSLLWIPGYLLQDEDKSNPAVALHTKWYLSLTNKLTSKTTYTTIAFILTTIYAGFFYEFNMTLLTLSSALIFAVWFRFAKLSSFRQQQAKYYSYTAIIINILVLISLAIYIPQKISHNVTINISDIEVAQITN